MTDRSTGADDTTLGAPREDASLTIARNLSTRYVALGTEMIIGLLVMLSWLLFVR